MSVGAYGTFPFLKEGRFSDLMWSSSDDEVVTIDDNGAFTALSEGVATITVTAKHSYLNTILTAKVDVHVYEDGEYSLVGNINSSNFTCSIIEFSAERLVSVIIPEYTVYEGQLYTITSIEEYAFAGNEKLKSVVIPPTITNIEPGAFNGCSNLETVHYYPDTLITTNDHQTYPIFSYCYNFKNLQLKETVKEISEYTFKDTDIEVLNIPDNVEALRNDCFADCYKLLDIKIGRGVTTIDCAAFAFGLSSYWWSTKIYCNAREITYYRGLGGDTSSFMPFNNRDVYSIEFGPDVERLDDYAFTDVKPGDIYCNATTPPVVANSNVLKSVNKSTCTLHVPAESLQLYQTAYFWKDFYNIKGDISGIDDITIDDSQIDYSAEYEVYNLSGRMVGDDIEGLQPGVYIIRQGRKVEKRMIK